MSKDHLDSCRRRALRSSAYLLVAHYQETIVRSERKAGLGLGLALLSAATFGTSGTFARSLTDAGWTAEAAVVARVGIAATLLAIPAAIAMRGRWHVARRSAGSIAGYGLLAVVTAQVCFFNAVQHIPVGVALLLEYAGIIIVVGWMWAVHGERPRRLTVAGTLVAVAGLALVLDLTGTTSLDPIGVAWGLGAAAGLAGYFILSAHIDDELPAVALACGGMAVGAAALLALGATGLLSLQATFGDVAFAGRQTSWLVPVIGLSVVAAVIAYIAGIGAARILGAHLSSFVGLTEVLFAVLVAWIALGELPTPIQLAGGALIVAGIALVRIDSLRADGTAGSPDLVAALEAPVPDAPTVESLRAR
jgi:drug/metabolite transporter (DMT)-like permease